MSYSRRLPSGALLTGTFVSAEAAHVLAEIRRLCENDIDVGWTRPRNERFDLIESREADGYRNAADAVSADPSNTQSSDGNVSDSHGRAGGRIDSIDDSQGDRQTGSAALSGSWTHGGGGIDD